MINLFYKNFRGALARSRCPHLNPPLGKLLSNFLYQFTNREFPLCRWNDKEAKLSFDKQTYVLSSPLKNCSGVFIWTQLLFSLLTLLEILSP